MGNVHTRERGGATPEGDARQTAHGRPHAGVHAGVGAVLHAGARYYDLVAGLLLRGRERAFRERLVDLARLAPIERVLDVGCGTGSLALAARRRVGDAGAVHGIDASPEMIAVARRKARAAGVAVQFEEATAQALPFPNAHFDAVLSTLMLHHLPRPARRQALGEVRRVLRPGGRLLVVDFAPAAGRRAGLLARLHRHGHVAAGEVLALLGDSGFDLVEHGAVGGRDLHFALARAPDAAAPGGGR